MTNKNILDSIGSTEDAAILWDMSESNVKKLAAMTGKIKAKKLRRLMGCGFNTV